jgi:RimJ/RimL family protein N-acetyltransferase
VSTTTTIEMTTGTSTTTSKARITITRIPAACVAWFTRCCALTPTTLRTRSTLPWPARRLTRPDNWEPGEWDQLTRGEIGQWAMAIRNHEPVSICHTPAASTNGAEAGVWTRPDHRGAGLAPAVTASWQRLERTRHRTLFYSTDRNNLASRAVARKLALLPLGWLWTVR